MNNFHSFVHGTPINRQQNALTLDDVAHFAPSAMAIAAHESRSARYTYIPTVDIIRGMMAEGFQPFRASQSTSRIEGRAAFTKHMIRFRHAGAQLQNVGDIIPEVVLINSHDGSSAYKLIAGLFRLVCSNGLMVSDAEIAAVTVRHQGNILENVIEGSYSLVKDSQKAIGTAKAWSALQLTDGEQKVFGEAAHTLRFADAEGKVDTPITAAQLLAPRRSADAGNDLWKTFNRVQENTLKGGLHARAQWVNGERRNAVTTREVKGIDQDVKLNRALWTLTERMAELKGGSASAA